MELIGEEKTLRWCDKRVLVDVNIYADNFTPGTGGPIGMYDPGSPDEYDYEVRQVVFNDDDTTSETVLVLTREQEYAVEEWISDYFREKLASDRADHEIDARED